jgi:hypothetical protein
MPASRQARRSAPIQTRRRRDRHDGRNYIQGKKMNVDDNSYAPSKARLVGGAAPHIGR